MVAMSTPKNPNDTSAEAHTIVFRSCCAGLAMCALCVALARGAGGR